VVICARQEEPLRQSAEEMDRLGYYPVHAVSMDMSVHDDIKGLLRETVDRFGRGGHPSEQRPRAHWGPSSG
jgi:hypothetical protein